VVAGTNDRLGRVWKGDNIIYQFDSLGVTVSPHGDSFIGATRGNAQRLWRPRAASREFPYQNLQAGGDDSGEHQFSPCKQLMCLAVWSNFEVWRVSDEAPGFVTALAAPNGYATNSAFSNDGASLAITGVGGRVVLYDTREWNGVELPESHDGDYVKMGFLRNGELLVTALGGKLCLYDTTTRGLVFKTDPGINIISLSIMPGEESFALGDIDGKVSLWDLT